MSVAVTHSDWLENDYRMDVEVGLRIDWKYNTKYDRYYFKVFIGNVEITDALTVDEKAHIEDNVLDQIKLTKEEYDERVK